MDLGPKLSSIEFEEFKKKKNIAPRSQQIYKIVISPISQNRKPRLKRMRVGFHRGSHLERGAAGSDSNP